MYNKASENEISFGGFIAWKDMSHFYENAVTSWKCEILWEKQEENFYLENYLITALWSINKSLLKNVIK